MVKWISKKFGFKGGRVVEKKLMPLLAVLLIIGCGSSADETVSPNGDPSGTFYSLAVLNRLEPGFTSERARGKALYSQYCVICHGSSGDGNGFNAYTLKSNFGVQPFNFTDSTAFAQIPLEEVKRAIAYGGPAVNRSPYMPPWGNVLSEYDLACLTDYLRHSFRNGGRKK